MVSDPILKLAHSLTTLGPFTRPSVRVSPDRDAGGGVTGGGEHPSAPEGTGTTQRKHPSFGPPNPSTPWTSLYDICVALATFGGTASIAENKTVERLSV